LCNVIGKAITIVTDALREDSKSNSNTNLEEIIETYKKSPNFLLLKSDLTDMDLKRPSPDKVFRLVERKVELQYVLVFVPISNAIGIVLRNNLTKGPATLDQLEEILSKDPNLTS